MTSCWLLWGGSQAGGRRMPLGQVRRYACLVREGPGNEQERLDLLREQQARVENQLTELQECLRIITRKVGIYEQHLSDSSTQDPGTLLRNSSPTLEVRNLRYSLCGAAYPFGRGMVVQSRRVRRPSWTAVWMWTPSRLASTAGSRSDAMRRARCYGLAGLDPVWRSLRVRVWGATGRAARPPGEERAGARVAGVRGAASTGRGQG